MLAACGAEGPAGPTSHPPELKLQAAVKGRVAIEDGWVFLHVQEPVFHAQCVDEPKVEKLVDGRWVPLQDDRPPSENHPAYYLDDTFIRAGGNEGCDTLGCDQVRESWRVAQAAEFVRSGTRPDPEGKEIERIETRPLTAPVRVRLNVHRSKRCDAGELATFTQQGG